MDEGIVNVRINKVIDGDTVEVTMGNIHHRIRLYGVDAPEHDQSYGEDAQSFLECITPYGAPAELELVGAESSSR